MAILRVNKMEKVGKQTLPDGPMSIGRSLKNDMCLPHPSVSRHHCTIEILEGHPMIRDLDSRHGTTVNGKAIQEKTLHDGDVIGLGIFEINYCDANAPRDDGADHDFDLEILSETSDLGSDEHENESTGVVSIAPSDRIETSHEAELVELRNQVAQLQQQFESQQGDLEQATQLLAEVQGQLQDKAREFEDSKKEIDRLEAAHQENIGVLREDLTEAESALEREKSRIEEVEAKLVKQTEAALEQLQSFEKQRAEHDERLKQYESEAHDSRKKLEKSELDLHARSEELKDALARIVTLEGESTSLKEHAGDLSQKSKIAAQFLEASSASAQQLMHLLQQLATVRKNVSTLETAYVQANQLVDEAEAVEAENTDAMIRQREELGEQLERAHGQLDSTISELQQSATRFCQSILTDSARSAMTEPAKRGFFSRLVKQ